MNVNPEGIETKEKDVDSQIVLEVFYLMWRSKVFLNNPASIFLASFDDFVAVSGKENAFALSQIVRFYNVSLSPLYWSSVLIYEIVTKVAVFRWHNPRFRKKLKLLRVDLCQFH